MKTVKEYIEEQKSKITVDEIVASLESVADYARDTYGYDLSEEYHGNHTLEEDPWLKDIIASEKAIEIINAAAVHESSEIKQSLSDLDKSLKLIEYQLLENQMHIMQALKDILPGFHTDSIKRLCNDIMSTSKLLKKVSKDI